MKEQYKRIIIIGNIGTGKALLAQKIGRHISLPVHHLEPQFWSFDKDSSSSTALVLFPANEKWIIEGGIHNFRANLDSADLIIYLKFSLWLCFKQLLKFMIYKKTLSHNDKMIWEIIEHLYKFKASYEEKIEESLENFKSNPNLITLHTPDDVEDFEVTFVKNLSRAPASA